MSKDEDKRVKLEMDSMAIVYAALNKLDSDGQRWVLRCVMDRLGMSEQDSASTTLKQLDVQSRPTSSNVAIPPRDTPPQLASTDGISPVASKWMIRNDLTAASLSSLYSLGLDEIDLVAKTVPGKSKKERTRSVLLLQGIASYLSNGVPRVSHEKVKEACLHYDGETDSSNFRKYMNDFAREVGGSHDTGYQLTASGLTNATDLIKALISHPDESPARKRKS
jgi:hypothetical protein